MRFDTATLEKCLLYGNGVSGHGFRQMWYLILSEWGLKSPSLKKIKKLKNMFDKPQNLW